MAPVRLNGHLRINGGVRPRPDVFDQLEDNPHIRFVRLNVALVAIGNQRSGRRLSEQLWGRSVQHQQFGSGRRTRADGNWLDIDLDLCPKLNFRNEDLDSIG